MIDLHAEGYSVEQKFERIAEAGFAGVFSQLPEQRMEDTWLRQLQQHKLTLGIQTFPKRSEELTAVLKKSRELGVQYINAQVADPFITGKHAVQLLRELIQAAAHMKMPYFIETHRGKITQDLIRTLGYIEELPELRLTLDLSHYVLAGEICTIEEATAYEDWFNPLLKRTSCIHGRISNGEQIQIDVGADTEIAMTERFMKWWTASMRYWLHEAGPGDILPFVCELGPPPYAMTCLSGGAKQEISNRWTQSLMMKQLTERCWQEALLANSNSISHHIRYD